MKAADRLTADYDNFFTLHIDSILPYDKKYFGNNGTVNDNDYREFWLYLSGEIQKFNHKALLGNQSTNTGTQKTYHKVPVRSSGKKGQNQIITSLL